MAFPQSTVGWSAVCDCVIICFFIVAPFIYGAFVFIPRFVMKYFVYYLVFQLFDEEERACCFTLAVFLMSCDCKYSEALSLDAFIQHSAIVIFLDHSPLVILDIQVFSKYIKLCAYRMFPKGRIFAIKGAVMRL